MPAFVDNMTFGGRKISGFGASEKFAGQVFSSTVSLQDSAETAQGIDLGAIHGNYKDWYHLRIQTLANFSAGSKVFKLYTSDTKDSGYEECLAITVKAASLNTNKNTPFEISLPSDVKRFIVLGVTGAASDTGAVLATVEPKAW